jgi:uncharacterized protein with von Willebrand factor type A (vWA) domain
MGEERRYRTPQIIPPSISDSGAERNEADSQEGQPAVDLSHTYSAREVLREKDFAEFTPAEMSQARAMMAELSWDLGRRRTRRLIPGEGASLDLRRTFRRNLKYGSELLELARRQPNDKPRPLVLICDVSGSMERYTRMLLHFIHTIAGGWGHVEAFLFATRLTRITRFLGYRNVDQAVSEVSRVVPDWAGGTRIGDILKTFNFRWARRVMRNHAVVLVISDGWDRGEPELLAREMARLQRSCHRLIWLNPLLGSPNYQPLTRGMQAALPYIDDFLPVHNLNSLESLARHLNRLSPLNKAASPSFIKRKTRGIPQDESTPEVPTLPQRQDINPALAPTFNHPLWEKNQ